MLFGLGIGLIIALGVYLNGPRIMGVPDGAQLTELAPPQPVVVEEEPAAPVVEPPVPEPETVAQPVADSQPAAEANANAEDPNRFSFYDLLPNFEVVIPEVETPAAPRAEAVAIDAPGLYMLQAGSFLTAEDAEAQRARLGLLGIESRIQRVTIDDRAFHRVRVGPIEDIDELNSILGRLRNANVDSMVMRVDP